MTRLFAFGCSFTNYLWSTWVDCLAPEFDYVENWGQAGGGNHFIFNSLMEADQRHQFGAGDTVIVCWTSTMREDRYTDQWQTIGAFNTKIYDPGYLREWITERGCLIRDLAMIKAAKVLLESRPDVNWKFLSMCHVMPPYNYNSETSTEKDIYELYNNVLDSILPSYYEVVYKDTGWIDQNGNSHPTPLEHLQYIDNVLPGWVTKAETRAKMQQETDNLQSRKTTLSTVTRL
jgi:hypothetical protein